MNKNIVCAIVFCISTLHGSFNNIAKKSISACSLKNQSQHPCSIIITWMITEPSGRSLSQQQRFIIPAGVTKDCSAESFLFPGTQSGLLQYIEVHDVKTGLPRGLHIHQSPQDHATITILPAYVPHNILTVDFRAAVAVEKQSYEDCISGKKVMYPDNVSSDWYCAYLGPNFTPNAFIDTAEQLYNRAYATLATKKKLSIRIPKIIHMIWIGNKELPEEYKRNIAAWKAQYPDWQLMLWDQQQVDALKLYDRNALEKAPSITAQADVVRYNILEQHGGVYVDIDTRPLELLDGLLADKDFVGILYGPTRGTLVVDNFFIAATPHHPIIKETLINQAKFAQKRPDLSALTDQVEFVANISCSVMPLTQAVCKLIGKNGSKDVLIPIVQFNNHGMDMASYGVHYPKRTWNNQGH